MHKSLCLFLLTATLALGTAAAETTNQMPKQFKFAVTETVEINYLLFLPEGYQSGTDKKWPLILFLHGAGERGTDIWKVAVHGPPKIVKTQRDFPFIVVSPQCREGKTWSSSALLALLDEVQKQYRVDETRVYLTGLSMGGYGTWDLGLSNPDRFAAIVPICGGGQIIKAMLASREKQQALRTLGVWAFHGGKDQVVPLEESQRMIDGLKRLGLNDVKLTVYPEAGHDSWTETYNNPELYEWLLKHVRK